MPAKIQLALSIFMVVLLSNRAIAKNSTSPSERVCKSGNYNFERSLENRHPIRHYLSDYSDSVDIGADTLLSELAALSYVLVDRQGNPKSGSQDTRPFSWQKAIGFAQRIYGFKEVSTLQGRVRKSAFALVFEGIEKPESLSNRKTERSNLKKPELPPKKFSFYHDALILSIRGTFNLQDIFTTNLNFKGVPHPIPGYGKIHHGFQIYAEAILNGEYKGHPTFLHYLKKYGKERPIYITGHSLGGAAGLYIGSILHEKGYNVKRISTYGAPRIGDATFVERFNSELKWHTIQYRNGRDLVPLLPLKSQGYGDAGRMFWLNFKGELRSGDEYPFRDLSVLRIDKLLIALAHHAHILNLPGYAEALQRLYTKSSGCKRIERLLPSTLRTSGNYEKLFELIGSNSNR